MKQWLLPDTAATHAELAAEVALGPERRRAILRAHVAPLFNPFVLRLLGRRAPGLLEEAARYFLLQLRLRVNEEVARSGQPPSPARVEVIARGVAFSLPRELPKRTPLQMQWCGLTIAATPADLRRDYEQALAKIQRVKRGTWRSAAAFAQALGQAVPEMRVSVDIAVRYRGVEASDIALDYLIEKHRFNLGRDAVKKILQLARDPDRLTKEATCDLKRHLSHPLLPGPGGRSRRGISRT